MSTFTITNIQATGKSNDKFGSEFYLQLSEMSDTPALWFKKSPQIGDTLDLELVNGRWKKVKKEWNPQAPQFSGTGEVTTAPSQNAPAVKAPYKDNSDGMRQGMCINNAANFVNGIVFDKTLTDKEWAETVFAYAQALYSLGDLNKPSEATQEEPAVVDVPSTVQDVFGNVKAVSLK